MRRLAGAQTRRTGATPRGGSVPVAHTKYRVRNMPTKAAPKKPPPAPRHAARRRAILPRRSPPAPPEIGTRSAHPPQLGHLGMTEDLVAGWFETAIKHSSDVWGAVVTDAVALRKDAAPVEDQTAWQRDCRKGCRGEGILRGDPGVDRVRVA
jgi:hypothetical protein